MSDISPTDLVQPDAGAAAAAPSGEPAAAPVDGQGAGLYPSLDFITDEALRGQVDGVFKEWDGNVQKEFGKRADALKAWEPYDELGIRDFAPEDVQRLMAFAQMGDDDFKSWVQSQAEALDILGGEQPGGEPAAETPEGDPADTEAKPLTAEDVQRILEERETSAKAEQERQAAIEQASQEIETELAGLVKDAGLDELEPEAKDVVFMFASKVDGPDDIKQGFKQYMQMIGKSEKRVLQEKLDAPVTPNKGGRADATPKKASTFEEAQAATVALLQGAAKQ